MERSWTEPSMSSRRILATARPKSAAIGKLSIADLFTLVWDALADVLGTATTAAVLRRAARRAAPRCAELTELSISREKLEYRCTLPSRWVNDPDATTDRKS